MKKYNFHYWDVQILAAMMCGKTQDEAEEMEGDDIEQLVFDNFEISSEQLEKIVEVLATFTVPVKGAITGEMMQGFINKDCFIVKASMKELIK